jgi:hypothetical protein
MDRPGFETYSMMNMGMPMYPGYIPNMGSCQNNNQYQNLENEINNLKARVSKLENSIYPEAVDYNKSYYQNSLNMM